MWCVTKTNPHQPVYVSELCHSIPVVDTCTTRYTHVLYMGCGRGRCVGREPMYKGCGRRWVGHFQYWETIGCPTCKNTSSCLT